MSDFEEKIEGIAKKQATNVYNSLGTQYGVSKTPYHIHNNIDSPNIPFTSITNRPIFIHWNIPGTQAATSTNYGVFFIAPISLSIVSFSEVHQTAGSSGSAVTIQLEKLTGTTAPGSGTSLLTSALSLKTTANTVQHGQLVQTATIGSRNTNMNQNDRLSLKLTGTPTSVANLSIMVSIQY